MRQGVERLRAQVHVGEDDGLGCGEGGVVGCMVWVCIVRNSHEAETQGKGLELDSHQSSN